jgi:hypothetical protein
LASLQAKEAQELAECTHRPKINKYGAPIYVQRIAEQYQKYKSGGSDSTTGSVLSSIVETNHSANCSNDKQLTVWR